ncbi:heparinase II/III family protein [Cognatitamlana onchidii]|uniref:heparinase II/III family protein n=1 Tax=Cognatitamlana onchidii TaxID=2562860 RepID=UPI0014561D27|nr:heparinase II/III-family protein [Algibacter onchidii]
MFLFLNIKHVFKNGIDWNYSGYGKLWTFNLNYFDFLNQENIKVDEGLSLVNDYISNYKILKDGKESYTISLRTINWVKFLSKHNIQDLSINQVLFNDYQRLLSNLELQFLGNHYMENGFALLFGAYFFQDDELYKASKKILESELEEEILKDGAHFELSPMYHQTMLHRVLDCLCLVRYNDYKSQELEEFLKCKAIQMLAWLEKVTYKNGSIPMVNDSSHDIAPSSKKLFDYAKLLNLNWNQGELKESGYRKVIMKNYELFIDVGHIGASYQPAHAHADTFNFELMVKQVPIIVDSGTSTYEKNNLRQLQRSTESHNTVKIGDYNQSQVWSGFRVGNRAKVISINEEGNIIEATHDGYKRIKVLHTRKYVAKPNEVIIEDLLSKEPDYVSRAFFHFYPGIRVVKDENSIKLEKEGVIMKFSEDVLDIIIREYNYALGFNKTTKAQKAEVVFRRILKTHIYL